MNDNPLVKFLAELITRLFSGKPKFFAVIQWVSLIVGGLSGVIMYLQTTATKMPAWLSSVGNVVVLISSVVALIIAQLPNKSTPE
jgi:hypothetical protein